MFDQFTLKLHPIEALVNQRASILPGALKIVGIYHNYDLPEPIGLSSSISKNSLTEIEFSSDLIKKHCNTTSNKIWLSIADSGLENSPIEKRIIRQMSLEDEFENNILLLKFESIYPNVFDLIFIFFNKDKNSFELESNSQSLNSENKSLIGHLLFNSIKTHIETHANNLTSFNSILEVNRTTQMHLIEANRKLEEAENKHNLLIHTLIKNYTQSIQDKSDISIKFSEDALTMLIDFEGTQDELKRIVLKSAEIAMNLSIGNEAIVYSTYLQLERYQNKSKEEKIEVTPALFNRYSKTNQILDKYEKSARDVLKNDLPLTGKNVGATCPTPISAPAITDSIKNHRKKMLTLFLKHPDKWPIIKSEFKPIINILPKGPLLGGILIGA
jgi:hypothetical protein